MYTGVQHDFHIRWCSYRLTVTRQVSDVELELLNLPGHTSSFPCFSGVRDAQSLAFCVCFVDRLSFVLSLLAIVLSVHLRFTASDYLFGILKLFLMIFHLTKSGWCFSTCSVNVYEYVSLYRTIPNSNRLHFILSFLI
jgi:hypothetical protein